MTDEAALLAAVVAAPDDDTPRLVYSDWLDDHGQAERAEFIRAQVRVARAQPGDLDAIPAFQRQVELLRAHRADWVPAGWGPDTADAERWERGFVVNVFRSHERLGPADIRSFAEVPTLEEVGVLGAGCTDVLLRGLNPLPNLRVFDISFAPALTPHGVATIRGWPGLHTLRLWNMGIAEGGLSGLAGMDGLRSLSIYEWRNAPALTATAFAPVAALTGLEEVAFQADGVAGRRFDALAALPRLRRLKAANCELAADALDPLAGCPALEEVNIGGTYPREVSDPLLAALPRLPHLRVAHAFRSGATTQGYRALGRASGLEELWVGDTEFGDADLAALTGLTRLRRLALRGGRLTPAGLALLSQLPALRALRLAQVEDADAVAEAVTGLPNLRWLALQVESFTDEHVSRLRELPNLESLSLTAGEVTDRGIARLGLDSPLRCLGATGRGVTGEFVWDRRSEWAPRLELAGVRDTRYGLTWVDYGWERF